MLNWITKHYIELFAIAGVLCSAARMIVALTPTEKDDAAVKKVGKWLQAIAKLFGLDITQGRDIK